MGKLTPILATETTAAALLDMKPGQFRDLVQMGTLPRGREIAPGVIRWHVDDLRAIASGGKAYEGPEW